MAIVVEGEKDVVVVFPRLLPRREILEVVWRGAKACLWESGAMRMEKGQHKGKGKERAKLGNDE